MQPRADGPKQQPSTLEKSQSLYSGIAPPREDERRTGRHGRVGSRTATQAGAAEGFDPAGDRGTRSLYRRTGGRNRPGAGRDRGKARPAARRRSAVQTVRRPAYGWQQAARGRRFPLAAIPTQGDLTRVAL